MTENFENDAHDYLLNQMDAARRTAFEQELQRNPTASDALKRYADSMAGFACEVAVAESLSAPDHQAVLATLAKVTRAPQSIQQIEPPVRFEWRRIVWPMAAAVLVLLNLIDFERPLTPSSGRSAAAAAERSGDGPGRPAVVGRGEASSAQVVADPENDDPAVADAAGRGDARVAREAQRELEHLRANVAALQRDQARLRAEYDAVLRRHEEQQTADRSLNRLATMELVDAASYERGQRRGLVAVGRGILTEPGVVTTPDPGVPAPTVSSAVVVTPPAYAWSVFDETASEGTLNLYNLPKVEGTDSIQVWVKTAGTTDYQRVAQVPPEYYGSSGTVQYSLPESETPAEILVTVEPSGAETTAPTGPVVVRGP